MLAEFPARVLFFLIPEAIRAGGAGWREGRMSGRRKRKDRSGSFHGNQEHALMCDGEELARQCWMIRKAILDDSESDTGERTV